MPWFGVLPLSSPTVEVQEGDLSVVVYGRGGTISPFLGGYTAFSTEVSETLHLTEAVTRTWEGSGLTTFIASAGHATVIDYTARLRVYGNSTVIASENLFKPTPDANFIITVDLSALFAYRAAGDYTVSILARDAGGSTDSEESSPFTLPLPWWPTERVAISDVVTVVRV